LWFKVSTGKKWEPISKIPNTKKGLAEWLKWEALGPEFKPQYCQKKKKMKEKK
jgi:hypothetical protein